MRPGCLPAGAVTAAFAGTPSLEPLARPSAAEAFQAIGWCLATHRNVHDAVQVLADISVRVVPGARWASVSRCRDGRLWTVACSDPVARAVDALQGDLGAGPSVDAANGDALCASADVATDLRWSAFARRIVDEYGVRGAVATRLAVDADEEFTAVLTLYGDRVGAFGPASCEVAALLATCGGVGVGAVVNRERAGHLARALASSREIGVAMGVLMATAHLTREQAFDRLRSASQNGNRKLRDVAAEVGDTGTLVMPPVRKRAPQVPP